MSYLSISLYCETEFVFNNLFQNIQDTHQTSKDSQMNGDLISRDIIQNSAKIPAQGSSSRKETNSYCMNYSIPYDIENIAQNKNNFIYIQLDHYKNIQNKQHAKVNDQKQNIQPLKRLLSVYGNIGTEKDHNVSVIKKRMSSKKAKFAINENKPKQAQTYKQLSEIFCSNKNHPPSANANKFSQRQCKKIYTKYWPFKWTWSIQIKNHNKKKQLYLCNRKLCQRLMKKP